ncbi:MAG: hypothetical protein KDA76_12715 [Planctomycetaceae bacterium]|nr:hypothetical protein [Planctomycetaceae bacterium]
MSVPFEHDAEIDPELMLDHVLQFRKYGSAECPLWIAPSVDDSACDGTGSTGAVSVAFDRPSLSPGRAFKDIQTGAGTHPSTTPNLNARVMIEM